MTIVDRAILILTFVAAFTASQNAAEAHKHTHELACGLDSTDLCRFHTHPER